MTTFGAVLTRPMGMEVADRACTFFNGEIESGARRASMSWMPWRAGSQFPFAQGQLGRHHAWPANAHRAWELVDLIRTRLARAASRRRPVGSSLDAHARSSPG
jgi:hypothetical protein